MFERMLMTCRHAIIPVAGFGSRRLPITKAVEKEMMPVLNRPIIDYIVRDCVAAGITHIVMVVGEASDQYQKYFGESKEIQNYLKAHGKDEYLELVKPLEDVKFEYIVQTQDLPYGTTTPVAIARPLIPEGESAVVLMGDDVIYTTDKTNPIAELIEQSGDSVGLLTTYMSKERISRYGVLATDEDGYLTHMVEKPSADEAPTNMINISKYLFTSEMLDEVVEFYNEPATPGKEKYVNLEPLERYRARGGKVKVVPTHGHYLDVGTVEGWLHANLVVAKAEGIVIPEC